MIVCALCLSNEHHSEHWLVSKLSSCYDSNAKKEAQGNACSQVSVTPQPFR